MKKNVAKIFVTLITLLLFISPFVEAKRSSARNIASDVRYFSDGSIVRGGISTVSTDENGAKMNLHTYGLQNGHAVTIWWVIFNHPENCEHGQLLYRCGEGDLFGSGEYYPQTSIVYATGRIIGPDGIGDFSASLPKYSTLGALFGPGLTNPMEADIHLIIRDHGKALPILFKKQLTTFNGGCIYDPEERTYGSNICTNVQFSVHEQVKDLDED